MHVQWAFDSVVKPFNYDRVRFKVNVSCRQFIKLRCELRLQPSIVLKVWVQGIFCRFLQNTLWWSITLKFSFLYWGYHIVKTGRYACRETYTIMVFALEVPQLVRRLALILFQNDGLIESNWLIRILYLRLHKLGSRKGRQTLFELKRNFPRILIKSRLIVSIINRETAQRAELVTS